MNQIPVYILTGYLGAGKTTLLNKLLKCPLFVDRNIALIINEFGKIGVDGKLLAPGRYSKYEINKGSLFCICTQTDFLKALESIAAAGSIQAVLIEATGIAEITDIESFVLERHFGGRFEVKANICVVDALNYTKTSPFLRTINSQLRQADGIIISKTDLVPPTDIEKLKQVLSSVSPAVPIAPVGQDSGAFIETLTHRDFSGEPAQSPPSDIIAVSLRTDLPVNRLAYIKTIESFGQRILRLKGNVAFADGVEFVETVFDRVIAKKACDGLGSSTVFTVIGWRTTKEELTEAFQRCWLPAEGQGGGVKK